MRLNALIVSVLSFAAVFAQADRDSLPSGHYRVHVTYAPLPSLAKLWKEFGENNVSGLYDGRPWQKHASCQGMSETPGDRLFFVKGFAREMGSEEAIAEMGPLGYRPASHQEAYEFQKAHPELPRRFWIMALGSSALSDEDLWSSAALGNDSGSRIFAAYWVGNRWSADDRFLFVRQ